ncbi:LOW QUALITY PROTEIN: hypothetical protein OSB04_028715 [Centaurea solstitialis]|uniref:Uncharacterized protein n=1 Tax=Centaurea solstitialis TaxID=347529 RepID=A0AA38W9J3_9ASTR|nr:LOW QUALITY PROTEIN: hypothetical protein OSB04_028715 [Centaurea solstitialis]
MCSEGEHESVVGDMSKWPTKDTSESCKWISLTCAGMSEFLRECKYPNLLLLKLIHGDESLSFHDDFYQEMGKLKVLVYQEMRCPMSLTSLRCSINLRTLCFHLCSSSIDFSPIGDLSNLEVLSFTHCSMQELPSTVGNLKKLKLLDLTCTVPFIKDGLLEKLVKLEELYMRYYTIGKYPLSEIRKMVQNLGNIKYLRKVNGDELATCSKNLVVLEIEFLDNTALPKSMSFKKLTKFQISLGCSLIENEDWVKGGSSENTLVLVTNKAQLLDSGLNELFLKTKVLHLQADDIRDGPSIQIKHHFITLESFKLLNLIYLFTVGVANGLTKLERLIVSSCPVLETLLDCEHSGVMAIKFQALKFLSLRDLPKLKSFCNDVNVIELPELDELTLDSLPNFTSIYADNKPSSSMLNDTSTMQPFLNKEIVIPQLKKMTLFKMENLKEIWPSNNGEVRLSLLKEIDVKFCDCLVNLFPSNPMSLLHHLEALTVMYCGSVDVLFNIDFERVGDIEEVNSKLKYMELWVLDNLREIWRVKGENASNRCIMRFEALENIRIFGCENFNRAFPSPTIDFDMKVIEKGRVKRRHAHAKEASYFILAFNFYSIKTRKVCKSPNTQAIALVCNTPPGDVLAKIYGIHQVPSSITNQKENYSVLGPKNKYNEVLNEESSIELVKQCATVNHRPLSWKTRLRAISKCSRAKTCKMEFRLAREFTFNETAKAKDYSRFKCELNFGCERENESQPHIIGYGGRDHGGLTRFMGGWRLLKEGTRVTFMLTSLTSATLPNPSKLVFPLSIALSKINHSAQNQVPAKIASAIVGSVVETLMVPVKKNLGYVISCTKNVRGMNTKIGELNHTKNDVETHMNRNESSNLEIPSRVPGWLKDVVDIDALVESFPNDVGSCSLKSRHKHGKKALEIIENINGLIGEESRIKWSDHRIPLGKVDSMKASTSTPSSHHDEFESRQQTFLEALKALESDHKSHMVALCGMGGVGKTTMMEKLKKVVTERKLFNFIQAVAVFLGLNLIAEDKATRASELRRSFEAHSREGKKFLVVLDDVWEFVDLSDIGLSPLPNQGVDFKILLTSRNRQVCIEMGVELNSILDVKLLTVQEAKSFFFQFARISEDVDLDHDLRNIGDDIAKRCHGLPIAIKTIAYTLKGKNKEAWEDALSSLNHHRLDERLHQIFEMRYNNLQEEEARSSLLLCGLFHKQLNTPKEDLVRYGWGLNLFNNVDNIQEARNRLSKHIEQLIDANLLIKSQDVGFVKMHDLVHAFVLRMCSKSKHGSIVGNMSKWPIKDTSESCKRISLTCTGMSEFPRDCKYPNLLLLRLTHGDELLQFHDDFYQEMGKLEVLVYHEMRCPITLRSLGCSTNLRTLCFHQCLGMFDLSPIGDLFNIEVLSFSNCRIGKLPSAIGKLNNLKLLELIGDTDPCIEDGVLKNLVKLEELHIRKYPISFSDTMLWMATSKKVNYLTKINSDELATCSKNLVALDIEFLDNNALPKGMSFKKLTRFKISLGCSLMDKVDRKNWQSFENTLLLVTNKDQLLEFRINELFEKTKVLHLEVDDIRDGLVHSFYPHQSSFYNLRCLRIVNCVDLRYLFTVGVANGLTKLECLTVFSCPVLETLLDSENSGVKAIKFQALKFLCLRDLPKLKSFCNNVNAIELPQLEKLILDSLPNVTSIYPDNNPTSSMLNDTPAMQSFLNSKTVIPRLKEMKICKMENLKEIWPSNDGEAFLLERDCSRRMPKSCEFVSKQSYVVLYHLEELTIIKCDSIDVLFNIDLGCVGEIEEVNSKLKSIKLWRLGNLREIWRVTGENPSNHCIMRFEALENIKLFECESLNRVLPSTISFDMEVTIKDEDWLEMQRYIEAILIGYTCYCWKHTKSAVEIILKESFAVSEDSFHDRLEHWPTVNHRPLAWKTRLRAVSKCSRTGFGVGMGGSSLWDLLLCRSGSVIGWAGLQWISGIAQLDAVGFSTAAPIYLDQACSNDIERLTGGA